MLTRPSHEAAVYSLGPWLVGMCIDMLLQGALFTQVSPSRLLTIHDLQVIKFANYFTWYGSTDGYKLTLSVAILALITTLKSVQALLVYVLQTQAPTDTLAIVPLHVYPLPQHLFSYSPTFLRPGNPLIVSLISLYVQSYFCYRLYVVSKRWWIVMPVLVLYLFSVGSVAVATYYIARSDPKLGRWLAVHYATIFASDVILAGTTAYFLLKTRKLVLPHTTGVINALIRLTFQTATPAVICTTFNLVFTYLPSPYDKGISSAFIQALPKVYAVSMMWTLNARRAIMREPTPMFASGAFRITEGTDSFMHANLRRRLTTGDIQFATIDPDQYSDSESQILNVLSTVLDDDAIPKRP
ncbi:hypothetical protein ARMSODRAFT_1010359 [Armillaria solidipes]|uniref:DUF6534 domain-containing protein n=1 Tax=Armillaria solidipes TaxID=1076256 RepID=A0A2H3CET4_9AGAR|nr:hypothetical protein ARMSODRAFT_1010359 [Armillaria solidipes]